LKAECLSRHVTKLRKVLKTILLIFNRFSTPTNNTLLRTESPCVFADWGWLRAIIFKLNINGLATNATLTFPFSIKCIWIVDQHLTKSSSSIISIHFVNVFDMKYSEPFRLIYYIYLLYSIRRIIYFLCL